MILLFEGYPYTSSRVEQYIKGFDHLSGVHISKDKTRINYVGYFLNNALSEGDSCEKTNLVLILPKVFVFKKGNCSIDDVGEEIPFDLGEYKAFGEYDPEELIDFNFSDGNTKGHRKSKSDLFKNSSDYNDIFTLSIWTYQALRKYRRHVGSNAFVKDKSRSCENNTLKEQDATLLDLALSLKTFAEKNQDFFMFVYKNAHSGFNKINWRKTLSKELPIPINNSPVYLNPHNKKKSINYDEELLIILFSTLNELERHFEIKTNVSSLYETMSENEYKSFSKRACIRLREIRYRYFSDKTLELWQLLFDYFNKEEKIRSDKSVKDFLLISNFDSVFEDMIDYLISDSVYPTELKNQDDNKFIDHIYSDKSLIYDALLYYVGDSKYYKNADDIERKSIAKQYTYAKNIVQRNIEVFYELVAPGSKQIDLAGARVQKKDDNKYFKYRDELTEGYNITPNFFITGIVERKSGQNSPLNIEPVGSPIYRIPGSEMRSRQFENRLFDRDTLYMLKYNVNFMYCLSCYVYSGNSKRNKFKELAHKLFKEGLRETLNSYYDFYRINIYTESKLKTFVDKHFRSLVGKIFSFYETEDKFFLLLALEKESKSNVVSIRNKELLIDGCIYAVDQYVLDKSMGLVKPM